MQSGLEEEDTLHPYEIKEEEMRMARESIDFFAEE